MPPILNRYATPFITGLFIVSTISGLGLFFHIGPSGFHGMHEWLSLLLVVPFGLHLWKNWRPLLGYLKRAPMGIALGLSALAAAVFLIPTGEGTAGGPPPFAFSHRILANPVADLAPLLGTTPTELTARLVTAGVPIADPTLPLADAIAASGTSEMRALEVLLAPAG